MASPCNVAVRRATLSDAAEIAVLHCDSWRRHYRGAYANRYLDGDLEADRLSVWTDRLANFGEHVTLVAEQQQGIVGFAHVVLDADPYWGALGDNLHVALRLHRSGIGTLLLAEAAREVVSRRPESRLHLWVQEQNRLAQAFYTARLGELGEREPVAPPKGDRRNLDGTPLKIRVSWSDPATLFRRT